MLFKRRDKPPFPDRLRAWVWPKRGWRRAWNYVLRRVIRLSGSPDTIARGFAAGVFASFTPFVGFHFILGFFAAFAVRGNMLASAFGTFIGNPLTFPFIWFATYKAGAYLLGLEGAANPGAKLSTIEPSMLWTDWHLFWERFWEKAWPVFEPMLVAGVPIGVVVGLAFYWPVKFAIAAYQQQRRDRLEQRRQTRQPPVERDAKAAARSSAKAGEVSSGGNL